MTTQSLTLKPTESVTPDKRRRTLDLFGGAA